MAEQVLYEIVYALAEKHIPKGRHKLLHVNSREAWTKLVIGMVEAGLLKRKLATLTNCAVNWEALLAHKLSLQN